MECSCSVLSVRPFSGYYPACPRCSRKTNKPTAANEHCLNRYNTVNIAIYFGIIILVIILIVSGYNALIAIYMYHWMKLCGHIVLP